MVVFNTWITILCSHDCLKSGSHGHHQMLCFLLERLCLAFTADTYGCWLFVGLFVFNLVIEECFIYLHWETFGLLLHFALSINDLHRKALFSQFCSMWVNLSRQCSPAHITIHPAPSISGHIIINHLLTLVNAIILSHNIVSTIIIVW